MGDELAERGIEKELVDHVKEFLMELGKGFAFVGSQYQRCWIVLPARSFSYRIPI